ncbi:MAG: PAS domain S-box protein [Rhodospirillaceae bacterium]
MSNLLQHAADRVWQEKANKSSQWLSDTVLNWMEGSYAPMSAISMLQDASETLSEEEFFIAYDSLEARSTAYFIDVIATAENAGGIWTLTATSDGFSPLSYDLEIEASEGLLKVLNAASARPGRLVLGEPFQNEEGLTVSPMALVSEASQVTHATLGLLNFNSLVEGLFTVHAPDGIDLILNGRFPNEHEREAKLSILPGQTDDPLFRVTTRTITAEAEIEFQWLFNEGFEGGPNTAFSRTTRGLGISLSVLLALLIGFLTTQNRTITKRIIAATALLKEREERLSYALRGGDLGFWDVDLDSGQTVFNGRYGEIFGYDPARREGTRKEWIERIHHEDKDVVLKHGQAFRLGGEKNYEAEYRIITPEGLVRWIVSKGGAVAHHQDGTVLRMVGTVQDITARKEAEKRIAASEERARLLLHSVGEGVFGVDTKGVITFVNPECISQLGYSEAELLGTRAHALFHHTHLDGRPYPVEECWMYKSFTLGKSYRIDDEVLWHKDGTAIPVEYNSTPISRGDEVVGAVVSFNDISERLDAQNERDDALNVISGSINYSSQIQRSILPDAADFAETFADSFVIWEPRDVVGGDIYWKRQWGAGSLIILGDCTGHGVPGAFMTLIATGALDRSVEEIEPGQVGALIQRMHQLIQNTLGQDSDGGLSDDGLELGACYLPYQANSMTYAGARFELFIVTEQAVDVVKGTKAGLGYRGTPYTQSFEDNKIDLSGEASFYLASDGVWDQVGGERRRTFGKKRFRTLLQDVQGLPMAEQKDRLLKSFADYQGYEMRRDDVSCIGFRPVPNSGESFSI